MKKIRTNFYQHPYLVRTYHFTLVMFLITAVTSIKTKQTTIQEEVKTQICEKERHIILISNLFIFL